MFDFVNRLRHILDKEKRRGRVPKCPAVSHHLGASNPRYDLNTATSWEARQPQRHKAASVHTAHQCITGKMCRRCDLRSDLCQLMGPVCVYTPSSSSVWSPGEHRPKLWFISGARLLHMYIRRVDVQPMVINHSRILYWLGKRNCRHMSHIREVPPKKVLFR